MSVEVIHTLSDVPQEIDAVVELGKNLGEGWDRQSIRQSQYYLSPASMLNVLAAGMLYAPDRDIVLSGGDTIGPGYPTQPQAARDYLFMCFPNLPRNNVVLEESGFDTAASAAALGSLVEERGYRHVALVSVGYHVKNAARLCHNYGVSLEVAVASEGIVRDYSPELSPLVAGWSECGGVARELQKEKIRGWLLNFDRHGKLVRQLTAGRVEG